jgi:hypothetical protein
MFIGGEPITRLARRFAVPQKADYPAPFHTESAHPDASSRRELPPQLRSERFGPASIASMPTRIA